jgi:hypothetical protein
MYRVYECQELFRRDSTSFPGDRTKAGLPVKTRGFWLRGVEFGGCFVYLLSGRRPGESPSPIDQALQ